MNERSYLMGTALPKLISIYYSGTVEPLENGVNKWLPW